MEHIFSTRDNQFHLEQLTPIQKFYSIQGVLAYEDLIDRAMLLFCEQLEGRFINGNNAGKTCNLADWTSYCESQHPMPPQKPRGTDRPVAWDLLSEITWSSEMGFMKTGTDIKNMIHIGELSMMYLGLVCLVGFPPRTWYFVNVCFKIGQVPWVARLLSMNPYRPKTVDAFDHVIYFSLARLMERISGASQPASSSAGKPEKSGVTPRNDYIASFLEAQKAYPDVVTNDNIVMYILTNVSRQSSSNSPEQETRAHKSPRASRSLLVRILLQPSRRPSSTTCSVTPPCSTGSGQSWTRPTCPTRPGMKRRTTAGSSLTWML